MKRRQTRREFGELPLSAKFDEKMGVKAKQLPGPKRVRPFAPLGPKQDTYAKHIRGRLLTIGAGCAGTGKTYCSVSLACEMLVRGDIEKIIATRPAVEADEDLGYLPGSISEKFEPYFAPIMDILNERLGASFVTNCIRSGKIVAQPLAYMRGHTFKDAFVLVDEAQNMTPGQMKMLLTRLGEPVKCVVEGDETQTDIDGPNGLEDILYRFRGHRDVGVVRFTEDDVVRSGFCRDVLLAYRHPVKSELPSAERFNGVEVDLDRLPPFIVGAPQ